MFVHREKFKRFEGKIITITNTDKTLHVWLVCTITG